MEETLNVPQGPRPDKPIEDCNDMEFCGINIFLELKSILVGSLGNWWRKKFDIVIIWTALKALKFTFKVLMYFC